VFRTLTLPDALETRTIFANVHWPEIEPLARFERRITIDFLDPNGARSCLHSRDPVGGATPRTVCAAGGTAGN